MELVRRSPLFSGFEVLVATHTDKDGIHSHIIENSVSFDDGHKFQMKSTDLQSLKDLSDEICRENGLTITEKGKTFDGLEREETSSYNKDT